MAHLRNIQPLRPVRQQNQSDSSNRQSAGPKNPSPQTSNTPITCVKCGLYQIHTELSVSQGKYCCNTCFKTEGRQHGPKCAKEPATPAVPTPPVVQRQDRPTEEAAKPIADSTDPKRADTGADAAALVKSTTSSAAQGSKTEADSCFAKVVSGADVVERMRKQPAPKGLGFVNSKADYIVVEDVQLRPPA